MVEGAISEGPRDVNRGQRQRMRCAGQTHLAWTQVLWSLFVQGRRMDPRILFVRNSGRGQLQKPPRSSVDRRAFLAPGKGQRKGDESFFISQILADHFFTNPFSRAALSLPRSPGSFLTPPSPSIRDPQGPIRATVVSLSSSRLPPPPSPGGRAKGSPWISSDCDRERV